MRIENDRSKYGAGRWDQKFVCGVRMLDTAIICEDGRVQSGKVTLISRRGININTGNCGDFFVKWKNVVAVERNELSGN